jgi:8-oxo-dGTP pyrophosphatase MutT (NUDIX family)
VTALHDDALALLRSWRAPSPAQEQLRAAYVRHLEAHPDGVYRSCRPDHLTASTLVVSADGAEVLLTLHAKARAWFQMGGHCEDGDPALAAAAFREATEESGVAGLQLDPQPVQLSVHEVPFCRGGAGDGPVTRHLDVRFVAVAPEGAEHAVSDESLDVRWFPADALPTEADEMVELVALARQRLQDRSSSRAIAAAPSSEQSGSSATSPR